MGLGFTFNADKVYMSNAEVLEFKRLRHAGQLSFFRVGACKVCKADLLKGKTYCSQRCFMDHSIEATCNKLVDEQIKLETKDGTQRNGRLSAFTWHTVKVDGNEVRWPKGIILNGDRNDEIPWERLAWIKTVA